mmetsp:Transcript_94331/g.131072  ORF Transcript_94331/g.131072 Transcript_94331/m.131072 type:complete len:361 (-) Transcript_94331:8-1090(-)
MSDQEATTMQAIVAEEFGEPVDVLKMTRIQRPVIEKGKRQLLIRVQACSLSPGDWRMLSGDVAAVRTPAKWPYVPALDVAGVVVDFDPDVTGFDVGDEIVATWGGMMAVGGLAEYCLVDASMAAMRPKELTPIQASALVNSAVHALIAFDEAQLKKTDRILVLGGSGGAGTSLLQLIQNFGVEFVAATSTDSALLQQLGVHRPIDYNTENWWELQEFIDEPFDVVFDLAEGAVGWNRARGSKAVKRSSDGGRYYAFILDDWHIEAKSMLFLASFSFQLISRTASAAVLSYLNLAPSFQMKLSSPDMSLICRVMELGASGALKPLLVQNSAFPFTAEGAIAAFDVLRSRRAKGKVVIQIAD